MFKAIYPYCHENVKILSFNAGDKFIVLKQNENNWWLAQKRQGHIGLVPSNYIVPYTPDPLEFLEFILESSKSAPYLPMYFSHDCLPLSKKVLDHYKDKILMDHPHLIQLLKSKYVPNGSDETLGELGWKHSNSSDDALTSPSSTTPAGGPEESMSRTSSSMSSSNFRLSSTSSPPPPNAVSPTSQIHSSLSHPLTSSSLQKSYSESSACKPSAKEIALLPCTATESSSNVVPAKYFWSLVSQVRDAVNVDFGTSRSVVRLVLDRLGKSFPTVEPLVDEILQQEADSHFDAFKDDEEKLEEILQTSDARDLQEIFNDISSVREDSQQRSWALHEDEDTISQLLKKLLSILTNANPEICRSVVARDHYAACNDLILYYQMETRANLRMLLLEIFASLCTLGTNFTSELMTSVLPLELSRELQESTTESQNAIYIVIVLCMLFSTGETVPHNHYSRLNEDFLVYVLQAVEGETDVGHSSVEIPELLVKFLLSFNLHFEIPSENLCMKALMNRRSAKFLTEQILLFFNRGEDPVRIPVLEYKAQNSVMKFLSDIFSDPTTSGIFYTNDAKVLVDILLRQLTDLNPGDIMRTEYLSLTQLLLLNSDYFEHGHRLDEMKECLKRILDQEENVAIDKDIASQIFTQFEKFLCKSI